MVDIKLKNKLKKKKSKVIINILLIFNTLNIIIIKNNVFLLLFPEIIEAISSTPNFKACCLKFFKILIPSKEDSFKKYLMKIKEIFHLTYEIYIIQV
jgi:hypothetical protein